VLHCSIEPLDFWLRLGFGLKGLEVVMAALVRVLARKFPSTDLEAQVLKQIALFSGAGLLVSMILMSYGLDLSAGFF
jgi:hypothetical protein